MPACWTRRRRSLLRHLEEKVICRRPRKTNDLKVVLNAKQKKAHVSLLCPCPCISEASRRSRSILTNADRYNRTGPFHLARISIVKERLELIHVGVLVGLDGERKSFTLSCEKSFAGDQGVAVNFCTLGTFMMHFSMMKVQEDRESSQRQICR